MRRLIVLMLLVGAGALGITWWRWPAPPVVEPTYQPPEPVQSAESRLEALLQQQPLAFLDQCLEKGTSEVKSYTCVFRKRERVEGKLRDPEKIEIHFRQEPFSVRMHWLEGGGAAQTVLYVDGENDGKLLARPKFPSFLTVSREIDGPDAKQTSRFPISRFGMHKGLQGTLASMHRADERAALHLHYEGKYKVDQLGGRECYKLVRTPYEPPEEDELNELTVYIDSVTWMQVGSVLKDIHGELIAEYWFRDVQLNPDLEKKQFTRAAL